ncbi:hypothetical protein A33M_3715 [Rhodovulum sp. PH10]|uniref:DUF2244 domain-containing protein n=1 Tax=Rhodovulum sp. PH10 TaxID=1187851 RepID=UPI00027C1E7F|nr:DUF2244 domain-containing protein [Rhodovulum sp. PH10]EJW10974.1 hypothetical protein A33M_3715 [Rhodovulum sp. PH10]
MTAFDPPPDPGPPHPGLPDPGLPDPEPTLFSAVVTPHRSLDRAGFAALMLVLGGAGAALGGLFLVTGAWPITGFLGLDVGLVYWAFRASYRSGRAAEHVVVTPSMLLVRRVGPTGAIAEWTLNPVWARLDREIDPDFGTRRLTLVSHGRRLVVGHWLAPAEKDTFFDALAGALGEARRGPTRSGPADGRVADERAAEESAAGPFGNRVDPEAGAP